MTAAARSRDWLVAGRFCARRGETCGVEGRRGSSALGRSRREACRGLSRRAAVAEAGAGARAGARAVVVEEVEVVPELGGLGELGELREL